MSWDDNPYSYPEKHGLQTVGEVEWSDGGYQFDLTVVWRNPETGQLYIAEDSGCSCPSPFENFDGVEDLDAVTPHEAIQRLQKRMNTTDGMNLIERIRLL